MVDTITGLLLSAEVESRVNLIEEALAGRSDCEFFVADIEDDGVVGVTGRASFDVVPRESGYGFWRHRYGEPLRWDDDYFAPGAVLITGRASVDAATTRS